MRRCVSGYSLTRQSTSPDETGANSRRTLTAHPSWKRAGAPLGEGGADKLAQMFQVGDRVRTIRKHGDLPKGTNGTITRIFEAADCSDVQFDRHPGHRLIAHSDLAFIERTVEAAQT